MPLITSLLSKLRTAYPHISFIESGDFAWSPSEATVQYQTNDEAAAAKLLHEVAHAELNHRHYQRDIELLGFERDAWGYAAKTLSKTFSIPVDSSVIDDHLDSYRNWLHARSSCPHCNATGVQIAKNRYQCLACRHQWRVNEARTCQLRRYSLSNNQK